MSKIFLRKRQVAMRYGVVPRTVDRWGADGRLPAPTYRGKIPIWGLDELEARDRQAEIERASGAPAVAGTLDEHDRQIVTARKTATAA